ncbi:MAG: hypothetical protein HWN65_05340 [Candidatus Helarchaeota archaeon]|nr:hypothetical protein [Candidatus Helarchaeota archaeon]
MIHRVWLINRGGICIQDRDYTGLGVNRQLFSGFLTALNSLALQLHRSLDSLSMGDLTVYYELEDQLIIAVAVDRDDNDKEIRRKMTEIREDFKLKFGNVLDDWDGNLVIFDSFLKDLDRILMLDWNFEYNIRIKSDDMRTGYPVKNIIDISQRGIDLFKALQDKKFEPE